MTEDHKNDRWGQVDLGRVGSSVWWALGTACCSAWIELVLLQSQPRTLYFFVLGFTALVGAVVGPMWARENTSWISPPLIVAMVYPASWFIGAVIGLAQLGDPMRSTIVPILIGVSIGAIAPALRLCTPNPRQALYWGSYLWIAISVLLLSTFGLGILFVPLAVSYFLAAGCAPTRPRYRTGAKHGGPQET